MENGRILIADDHGSVREALRLHLEWHGHSVVREAASVEEALDVVNELAEDEVDVALVDGNLGTSGDGEDGAEIAAHIRTRLPGVRIIGISATGPVEGAHVSASDKTHTEVVRLVNEL